LSRRGAAVRSKFRLLGGSQPHLAIILGGIKAFPRPHTCRRALNGHTVTSRIFIGRVSIGLSPCDRLRGFSRWWGQVPRPSILDVGPFGTLISPVAISTISDSVRANVVLL